LVLVPVHRLLLASALPLPAFCRYAAVVCLLGGRALTIAALVTLCRHTGFDQHGQALRLVTGGPFALVRHPIAVGLGWTCLGLVLAWPSWLVLSGFLGCCAVQDRRLRQEEALLAERFGQAYADYATRVGRLWPRRPKG
ncbi:MAG: isoprenylcysteine carboxylmethyltransferase family protein, partial [Thermodesulfobacteriota bacterium]